MEIFKTGERKLPVLSFFPRSPKRFLWLAAATLLALVGTAVFLHYRAVCRTRTLAYAVWIGDTDTAARLLEEGLPADGAWGDGETFVSRGVDMAQVGVGNGMDALDEWAKRAKDALPKPGTAGTSSVLSACFSHWPIEFPPEGTPLICLAANCNDPALVDLLLAHGAKADARDTRGHSPIDHALGLGFLSPYESAPRSDDHTLAIVKCLMAHGGKINFTPSPPMAPPLNAAANHGTPELVEFLIAQGAKLDTVDDQGCQPLHWAARRNDPACTRILLAHGAKVDAVDKQGRHPLHWAAQRRDPGGVQALLTHGADVNAVDAQGDQPLHLASKKFNPPVIDRLLEANASLHHRNNQGLLPMHMLVYNQMQLFDSFRDSPAMPPQLTSGWPRPPEYQQTQRNLRAICIQTIERLRQAGSPYDLETMEKECDKAFDIYMEMDDIEVPLPKTPPPANATAPMG